MRVLAPFALVVTEANVPARADAVLKALQLTREDGRLGQVLVNLQPAGWGT